MAKDTECSVPVNMMRLLSAPQEWEFLAALAQLTLLAVLNILAVLALRAPLVLQLLRDHTVQVLLLLQILREVQALHLRPGGRH